MRILISAMMVLASGCDDGGEGTDCRGGTCSDGFFCDRVAEDKFRCVPQPADQPSGPFLNVEPGEGIVFPKTQPGAFETRIVQLRQLGDLPVTVERIFLFEIEGCDRVTEGIAVNATLPPAMADGCDFVIDWRPELPLVLEQGDFRDLPIRFKPRGGPLQTTWLVVESDDVRLPTRNVPLGVMGDRPRLDIDDDRVVFTPYRGEQSVELRISNKGEAPLLLDRMWMELTTEPYLDPETGEPAPEIVTEWAEALPAQIAPGDGMTVSIRYTPRDTEPDEAALFVATDDPDRQAPARVLISSARASATLTATPNPVLFEGGGRRAVVLENPDMPPLEVLDIRAEPEGAFVPQLVSAAFELRSLQTHELFIEYAPGSLEMDAGRLIILTNAENANEDGEVVVELRATNR